MLFLLLFCYNGFSLINQTIIFLINRLDQSFFHHSKKMCLGFRRHKARSQNVTEHGCYNVGGGWQDHQVHHHALVGMKSYGA
jgi:hypothetical protein